MSDFALIRSRWKVWIGLLFLAIFVIGGAPTTAQAQITVTTVNDEFNTCGVGGCSLREALVEISEGETITVPAGTYTLTLGLFGGLGVEESCTISGAGVGSTIVEAWVSPSVDNTRVFTIGTLGDKGDNLLTVVIENMTIRHGGSNNGGENHGGGIYNAANLTLDNVMIEENRVGANNGGGIYNVAFGQMNINNSTIGSNSADAGGGIFANGADVMSFDSSTISNNMATTGGGLYVDTDAVVAVRNSTISENQATDSGGGIYSAGANTVLANATVAFNDGGAAGGLLLDFAATVFSRNSIVSQNTTADCSGPGIINSQGYNVFDNFPTGDNCPMTGAGIGNDINGQSALLMELADNGGTTMTHALTLFSPALDGGNPSTPGGGVPACEEFDQVGTTRPVDGDGDLDARCDIGAYEEPAVVSEPSIFADGFEPSGG